MYDTVTSAPSSIPFRASSSTEPSEAVRKLEFAADEWFAMSRNGTNANTDSPSRKARDRTQANAHSSSVGWLSTGGGEEGWEDWECWEEGVVLRWRGGGHARGGNDEARRACCDNALVEMIGCCKRASWLED